MAYPTPPSSTSSVASPSLVNFADYVHYTGKAAELAREAILQLPQLHSRIAELEKDLEIWKSNHQESSQRAKDAQRQLDSKETMIACFLDGDGCIFDRSLIRRGRDGGQEAALALRSNIADYAELQGLRGELTVVITLFLSKSGLAKALHSYGLADESTFSAFLQGLNAAHPLIQVTDVGPQKEAADAKLRENVRLYSKLPSCKLVLAGCSHDGGYAHVFNTLQTESPTLFKKLRLLHSYGHQDTAFELKRLNLESVRFEGMFEQRKLNNYSSNAPYPSSSYSHGGGGGGGGSGPQPVLQRKMTPVSFVSSTTGGGSGGGGGGERKRSGYTSSNGNTSAPESSSLPPKSPPGKSISRSIPKMKQIDPSKPLNKQAEPLCNHHYLSPPCIATVQGETCRYSHSYALTQSQLFQLRNDAQKSPCIYALKGVRCKDGDSCFSGHVCPRGENCKYGKSCRFVAPGMHPSSTSSKEKSGKVRVRTKPDDNRDASNDSGSNQPSGSTSGQTAILTRSQMSRKARGEARYAKYVVQLGGMRVAENGNDAESPSEDESDEDESGFETTSSID
ncbi:hypothetical protein JCM16303_000140 [Sporobolomyces ruberrimus]